MKIVVILVVCVFFLLVIPIAEVWLGNRLDAKESAWRQQAKDRIDAGYTVTFRYRRWSSSLWAALFLFVALTSGVAAIQSTASGSGSVFPLTICAIISLAGGIPYGIRTMRRVPAFTLIFYRDRHRALVDSMVRDRAGQAIG